MVVPTIPVMVIFIVLDLGDGVNVIALSTDIVLSGEDDLEGDLDLDLDLVGVVVGEAPNFFFAAA